MKTPDLTPIYVVVIVEVLVQALAVVVAVALGGSALLGLAILVEALILGVALLASDTALRCKRAALADKIVASKILGASGRLPGKPEVEEDGD